MVAFTPATEPIDAQSRPYDFNVQVALRFSRNNRPDYVHRQILEFTDPDCTGTNA